VRNGTEISLHRCSLPSVVDLTGQLKPKEKEALERGLKIINFSKKDKIEHLKSTVKLLGATVVTSDSIGHKIEVPACEGKVRRYGPIVGIDSQVVVTPALPAQVVHLPPLLDDPQLRRAKALRELGVFKKSDKGAALVFIPKATYREMGLKHLETDNYVPANDNDETEGVTAMQALVDQITAKGTPAQRKLLRNLVITGTRERFIYFLPKMHKQVDTDGLYLIRPIVDCRETALAAADKIVAMFCAPLNKAMWTTVSFNRYVGVEVADISR